MYKLNPKMERLEVLKDGVTVRTIQLDPYSTYIVDILERVHSLARVRVYVSQFLDPHCEKVETTVFVSDLELHAEGDLFDGRYNIDNSGKR